MRTFAIWDLDNCLFDDSHRVPFIDWSNPDPDERFEPYHQRMSMDTVHHLEVFRAVSLLAEPVFFTARPRSHEVGTRLQLEQHLGIHAPRLHMREVGDHRPSVPLKHHMLVHFRKEVSAYTSLVHIVAFDDRQEVIDMYVREGVQALRLAINDEVSAYHNTLRNQQEGLVHG